MSGTEDVVARIVEAVIADLTGRSGFDHCWDAIDDGIRDEIRQTLERKTRSVLDAEAVA
jgi:hypothetical protein